VGCKMSVGWSWSIFVSSGTWDLDMRFESEETEKAKVAKKLRKVLKT
jgi:hypothetical protein